MSRLPGFDGVTRGHIRGWVAAALKLAVQEPNEFGLVVHQQGRPATLPESLYDELKEQLVGLAKTKAFTLTATTMRPIVLAFIINKLGVETIRPGVGRFLRLFEVAEEAGSGCESQVAETVR